MVCFPMGGSNFPAAIAHIRIRIGCKCIYISTAALFVLTNSCSVLAQEVEQVSSLIRGSAAQSHPPSCPQVPVSLGNTCCSPASGDAQTQIKEVGCVTASGRNRASRAVVTHNGEQLQDEDSAQVNNQPVVHD